MQSNRKQTSPEIMQLASQVLRDHNASSIDKQLAASLLAQSNTSKQSGTQLTVLASQVMRDAQYGPQSKSLAASVLAQTRKR